MQLCLIGAGGAIGAIFRVFLSYNLKTPPWDILLINLLGSTLIGIVAAWSNDSIRPEFKQFLAAGFCGGFTTFSTFSLQTIELISKGKYFMASGNILLSVTACLMGCWAGLQMAAK